MTDEELEKTIKEIDEDMEKLSAPDKPLSKEENKRKQLLTMKKQVLEQIKQAKQKGSVNQEMRHTVTYGLLSSLGDKHPLLLYFMQMKFRQNIY